MKVAVKVYEEKGEDGVTVQDVVVNNRYIIPFIALSLEEILRALKVHGVTDRWELYKLGDKGCFEHKLTNLIWHGDIEVTE